MTEVAQSPGLPTPVASFNITQLDDAADKIGKDTNFRRLTIFNNVLYYTKGNGVNTVYFVDTTDNACPNGVGLPYTTPTLPAYAIAYDLSVIQTKSLNFVQDLTLILGKITMLENILFYC